MQRIEGANGLNWEGMASSLNNVYGQWEERPVCCCPVESGSCVRSFRFCQLACTDEANKRSLTLKHRQIGRQDKTGIGKGRPDRRSRRFVKQPGEHGTGFSIQIHRSPRSWSMSEAAFPSGVRTGRRG